MSSLPVAIPVKDEAEEQLTGDAWWDLFEQVRLSRQEAIAKQGGAVAWVRKLRESDTIYDDAYIP